MRFQDVLHSAGPQARHIEALWWLMLGVCTALFIGVLAAVIWALICLRSRSPSAARDLRVARAARIRRGDRERAAALRAACELPCERASLLVDGFRPAGPQRADRALRHDALYRRARRAMRSPTRRSLAW